LSGSATAATTRIRYTSNTGIIPAARPGFSTTTSRLSFIASRASKYAAAATTGNAPANTNATKNCRWDLITNAASAAERSRASATDACRAAATARTKSATVYTTTTIIALPGNAGPYGCHT
jgi:hypothetical protein